jgi:2-methylcitrate synthase
VHGKLPTRAELKAYKAKLKALRGLPASVKDALEKLPASSHPMDVMRTGVSVLGCVLPEKDDHNHARRARHRRPPDGQRWARCCCTGTTGATHGKRIDVETDDDSIGGTSCTCCTAPSPAPPGCAPCTPR